MIDIKLIRENPESYKAAAVAKLIKCDIDRLLKVDSLLREAKQKLQDFATEKNQLGKSVATAQDKKPLLDKLAEIKKSESSISEQIKELKPEFDNLIFQVPQPSDPEVPQGKDDTENFELRKWSKPREFDFEPKDHVTLGLALDIIDLERGVKIAGTRSYFLKGDGALLHWAVLRYSLDLMLQKGYCPMNVPLLMRDEAMRGTGYFPGGEDQAYHMEKDHLNLAGTSEVPVTAYHMGEILKEQDLPLKYCGMSTCFRREAGAAGKDTHGLYRIHQFDKVEQVIICENDEQASKIFHEEILANSEEVLQGLELPYRVVNVCTGDLGRGQAMKYDIETWMPSRNSYGETHSASRFYDFQARRMNLRYKSKSGKNLFCHTLNNTVIASPRVLIPILELNQNADGTINIPKVLQPYMCNKKLIEPR